MDCSKKNKNLGSWVWYQRERELYHKETLSSNHFLQLESIGLKWIVQKGPKSKRPRGCRHKRPRDTNPKRT
jgi:hypothetical protein